MKMKSAYHLQAYYKEFWRQSNSAATLLAIAHENTSLRREYRGPSRSTNSTIPEAIPCEQHARAPNSPGGADDEERQRVVVPPFHGGRKRKPAVTISEAEAMGSKTQQRSPRRCRQCGYGVRTGMQYYENHGGRGDPLVGYSHPHLVCTVPAANRQPGYPLAEGKPHKRHRS
jgi:hypothetical protein